MISGTQELKAPEFEPSSPSPEHEGFWSPLRKTLTHNLLGYLPTFASLANRTVVSPPSDHSEKPVVTYVDRQGTGRRLTEESHRSMLEALGALQKEGVCEVQIVRMEKVALMEQVRLVARSTVSFPLSVLALFGVSEAWAPGVVAVEGRHNRLPTFPEEVIRYWNPPEAKTTEPVCSDELCDKLRLGLTESVSP